MKPVVVYSTRFCPYCMMARHLLKKKNVQFEEIAVDHDSQQRAAMVERSGRYTVPQIFIGGQHIGGYDELSALERAGRLDQILAID